MVLQYCLLGLRKMDKFPYTFLLQECRLYSTDIAIDLFKQVPCKLFLTVGLYF